jgi:predicted PurR-regulated permease PerM
VNLKSEIWNLQSISGIGESGNLKSIGESAAAQAHLVHQESRGPGPVNTNTRLIAAVSVLALLAAVILLREGRSVLIPIVLSVLASYALEPIVSWLERRSIPRLVGASLVMIMLTAGLGSVVYGLSYQMTSLIDDLPRAARTVREQIHNSRMPGGTLEKIDRARSELERTSQDLSSADGPRSPTRSESLLPLTDFVWWGSAGLLALLGHATVMFFLIFFLLLSGDLFKRKLLKLAGHPLSRRKVTLEVLNEIDAEIKRYLLVRLFTSVVVAVGTWAVLEGLGLQNAAVWGLVAGVCNVVPYLGPVLVCGGIAIVGLLQFGNITMAAIAAGAALLVTGLEGWLLDPPLMGKVGRLNAVAVLIGLVFWTAVWGGWGALLAVPMLSVTKTICDRVEGFRGIGELLGE